MDQVASNLSNMVMTVAVARTTSISDFAHYAVIYACVVFLTGCQRAIIGEPLLIRYHRDERDPEFEMLGALGAGFVFVALVCAVGTICGVVARWSLVFEATGAIAACLAQDNYRFLFLASGKLRRALFIDGAWLIVSFAGLGVSFTGWLNSTAEWLPLWACGALIGIVFGVLHWRPTFGLAWPWMRTELSLSGNMLMEQIFGGGVTQIMLLLMPTVLPLSALAGVRAAQTSAGPLFLAYNAAGIAALPVTSRRFRIEGARKALAFARRVAVWNFSLGVVVIIGLLLIPEGLGKAALGASWMMGKSLAPIIALQVSLLGTATPIAHFLRVARQGRRSSLIRLVGGPFTLAAVLLTGKLGGVTALAVAMASCAAVMALIFQAVAERSVRASAGAPIARRLALDKG